MIITTSIFKSVRVVVIVQPFFTRAAHFRLSTANNPWRIENGLKTLRPSRSAFDAASQTAVIKHLGFRQCRTEVSSLDHHANPVGCIHRCIRAAIATAQHVGHRL